MEQDGSNPIRINCVILNFNDEETVARLVHMIHDYDYLEKIVLWFYVRRQEKNIGSL